MRGRGMKQAAYPARSALPRALLCFALAAGILLLSRAVWKQMRVAPFFTLTKSPQATASPPPQALENRAEADISLPGGGWFALQLGAFTSEESARKLASQFIPRGAAGFVALSEGAFRVFAAAYPTRADAQKVQTHLASQGVSTYIQSMPREAVTLRVGGSKAQIAALCDACEHLKALEGKLYALFCALDAKEIDASDARAALASESETCLALAQALLDAFDGDIAPILEPLHALLFDLGRAAAPPETEESAARTGAAIKHCHLMVVAGEWLAE